MQFGRSEQVVRPESAISVEVVISIGHMIAYI